MTKRLSNFRNGVTKLKNIIKNLWTSNGQKRLNNQLYIVQARPETVHGKIKKSSGDLQTHRKGTLITQGIALGDKIATGKARIPIARKKEINY
jgi:phosphoenolpyruvate synthase/pyruvate phosphate dikinase